ncbi:hypothetical protein JCM19000A_04170 [Silvimonas sp. JCM 19000]
METWVKTFQPCGAWAASKWYIWISCGDSQRARLNPGVGKTRGRQRGYPELPDLSLSTRPVMIDKAMQPTTVMNGSPARAGTLADGSLLATGENDGACAANAGFAVAAAGITAGITAGTAVAPRPV